MDVFLILGNQLFDPSLLGQHSRDFCVFMREDRELCTYYKFHKHKILFFLAAMRTYQKELEGQGVPVHYESFLEEQKSLSFEEGLSRFLVKKKTKKVFVFEIEDKFFEKRLMDLLQGLKIEGVILPSPMFLTSRSDFKDYLKKVKKPFMKTFYERQRKRLQILLEPDGEPQGGKWSFDEDNRLPLPSDHVPPQLPKFEPSAVVKNLQAQLSKEFASHPGEYENFWLPVDRASAKKWFEVFLKERLNQFGPYEDAIPVHSDFIYHSVLTPFLNVGLLTPQEVIEGTLKWSKKKSVPMASLEGFIRQVIGWREFVRGIYQNYSEVQDERNHFDHHRKLTDHWYKGNTGIAPLDHAIKKTLHFGYAHHIERLMVIGSLMLLLEVDPKEAHRWFMEMFIDSSDWVMGPNVYGMALFSDGGIFATKPYFCGSNYYRKMGGYKASESWCDGVDGLYWNFVNKNRGAFLKNPRLAMMVRTFDKMDESKKKKITLAAEALKKRLTQ